MPDDPRDTDGELTSRLRAAIHDAMCDHVARDGNACADCRTAAMLAVRDTEIERLTAELAEARDKLSRVTICWNATKAMNGVHKRRIRNWRQRAEQAEAAIARVRDAHKGCTYDWCATCIALRAPESPQERLTGPDPHTEPHQAQEDA